MGATAFALTGNVVTMTAAPNARVVYVENGKIAGVGDDAYAGELQRNGITIHDLGGADDPSGIH